MPSAPRPPFFTSAHRHLSLPPRARRLLLLVVIRATDPTNPTSSHLTSIALFPPFWHLENKLEVVRLPTQSLMVLLRTAFTPATLCFLWAVGLALAHGHDEHSNADMDMAQHMAHNPLSTADLASTSTNLSSTTPESYFTYPQHGSLMLAHIVLMTIAWLFVLPIGKIILQFNTCFRY